MARGWESKSVELQQEQPTSAEKAAAGAVTAEGKQKQRTIANLQLKRQQILDTKTSHPGRRSALQSALQDVEQELVALGQAI